jgi:hypothetical protein
MDVLHKNFSVLPLIIIKKCLIIMAFLLSTVVHRVRYIDTYCLNGHCLVVPSLKAVRSIAPKNC